MKHAICTNNSITEKKLTFEDHSHIIDHCFGVYINAGNISPQIIQERNKRKYVSFDNHNCTNSTHHTVNTIHP